MAIRKLQVPSSSTIGTPEGSDVVLSFYNDIDKFARSVKDVLDAGYDDDITLVIQFPEDGDYPIFRNSSFARTITQVTAICSSGSCTVTGKIGSTPLGGDPNSVTTSESVEDHDSDNEAPIGSDGFITVSSNSGCENLVVSIKYHRGYV